MFEASLELRGTIRELCIPSDSVLSDLANGVYLLQAGNEMKKIVKQ